MAVVLGIDVGTSSMKAMLLDTEKGVAAVHAKSYELDIPRPGYAQQDPEMWWSSLLEVLDWLHIHYREEYEGISAVGYSGQMHGLVLAGENGEPLCPAIIWLDQRADKQLEEIYRAYTKAEMGSLLCNRVSSGFAFPSLLWVKENEPEILSKVDKILSPKDYLRFKMTGKMGAEVTDASATGMFATAKRDWAWELLEKSGLPKEIFPSVAESSSIAGTISPECAKRTGLPEGIPVVYGAGDQQAQSIGNGVIRPGKIISNIGTGGQISAFLSEPVYDKKLRTNTFCHAIERAYTIFGATLCSGMSMNWIKNKILAVEDYGKVNELAGTAEPGSEGLLYLPYLSGERTPHMDPKAKGVFFGMTLAHGQGHFLRSVMEGVTYSLRDCMEILEGLGVEASSVIASGGGASSRLWLQIQADIFEKPVYVSKVKEQACLGACILAGAGTSILPSVEEGCRRFALLEEEVFLPQKENREVYRRGFEKYREIYKRLKDLM